LLHVLQQQQQGDRLSVGRAGAPRRLSIINLATIGEDDDQQPREQFEGASPLPPSKRVKLADIQQHLRDCRQQIDNVKKQQQQQTSTAAATATTATSTTTLAHIAPVFAAQQRIIHMLSDLSRQRAERFARECKEAE
jgi:hypothetical protein